MDAAPQLVERGIRRGIAWCGGIAIVMGMVLAALLGRPAAHATGPPPGFLPRGADTLHIRLNTVDTLATFTAPSAVRRDARGRLYVLEPAQHQVHVLTPHGTTQRTVGGAGARAGQLRRPAGFDPTNGHVLLIADTGNGRIQRLDASGQALEVVPIPYQAAGLTPVYPSSQGTAAPTGTGRPRAVQATAGDGWVVVESDAPAVWYLGDDRAPLRRLVPFDTRFADWRPHALVGSTSGATWVLDAEAPHVVITDAFGTIIAQRRIAGVAAAGFVDGFALGEAVGLVQARGIVLIDAETQRPRRHWRWPAAAAPLQSVTASRDSLYLLAGPHLLSMPR